LKRTETYAAGFVRGVGLPGTLTVAALTLSQFYLRAEEIMTSGIRRSPS